MALIGSFSSPYLSLCFFFQAEDGIRDHCVTGVQTCALPIYPSGRITVRPEGFGFVLVDGGPDLFIPRAGMGGAMDGDTVLAREERPRSRGRNAGDERIAGAVVRVLDRARERVVGRFEKAGGRAEVLPYDPRIDAVV